MKDKFTLSLINFHRNTPNHLIENIYVPTRVRRRGPSVQVSGPHSHRKGLFRLRLTECQMNSVFGTATLNSQCSIVVSNHASHWEGPCLDSLPEPAKFVRFSCFFSVHGKERGNSRPTAQHSMIPSSSSVQYTVGTHPKTYSLFSRYG
jgi:hypothetical protein